MINKHNNIENNLQQWMQQMPEINEEFAWAEMQQQLHPKKKRRFVFWFWFFGISFLFGSLVLYNYSGLSKQDLKPENIVLHTQKKESNSQIGKIEKNTEKNSNTNEATNDLSDYSKSKIGARGDTSNSNNNSNNNSNKNQILKESLSAISSESKKIEKNNFETNALNENLKSIENKKIVASEEKLVTSKHKNESNTFAKTYKKKSKEQEQSIANSSRTKSIKIIRKSVDNVVKNDATFHTNDYKSLPSTSDGFKLNIDSNIISKTTKQSIALNKKDSLLNIDTTNKKLNVITKNEAKSKLKLGYGLELNLPIPISKNEYQLTGKNLKPNPFNTFIPSFWVNTNFHKKHTLLLGFTPFAQYYIKPIEYEVVEGSWNNVEPKLYARIANNIDWAIKDTFGNAIVDSSGNYLLDTSINVTKQNKLEKAFGYALYLDYQYNISNHWQIGVGFAYNGIKSFINTSNITRPSVSSEVVYSDSSVLSQKESNGMINQYFLSSKFNIAYLFKKYTIGFNATLPVTPINKQGEIVRNESFYIFFRLKF